MFCTLTSISVFLAGTQAVMGVPAHDDRDLLFATEHALSVVTVTGETNNRELLLNSKQVSK